MPIGTARSLATSHPLSSALPGAALRPVREAARQRFEPLQSSRDHASRIRRQGCHEALTELGGTVSPSPPRSR